MGPFGMSRYQWLVLFAAWLGWGFDMLDGVLFSFVSSNCIPTLLHIPIGSLAAKRATMEWTGTLTSILLLGWAGGGLLFGKIADSLGRVRTLLITILMYAVGTAACAFAPNIETLILFRIIASLGIGGEWAAGATMVSEVVPENRRVEAGALLYTAAPFGLTVATLANAVITTHFSAHPEVSWRYVFLFGLVPAVIAFGVSALVREPERWRERGKGAAAHMRELFSPALRRATMSGLLMAIIALIAWWSTNAFLPIVARSLASSVPGFHDLTAVQARKLQEHWVLVASMLFNLGGLIGTLLTVPVANNWGRRPMYGSYFGLGAVAILAMFGLPLPPALRIVGYFFVGLTIFGAFGSFTYYLPELFPTRVRAMGAGFCYNLGRILAAIGPFLVGQVTQAGDPALVLRTMMAIGFVPLVGALLVPLAVETRGHTLAD